jgi:hypothetical protein
MPADREMCEVLCEQGGKMQVTAVDELTAAALGRFLRERDCAVYRTGTLTLEASPLGSVSATRAPSQLAAHLKEWLARHPGMPVRLDLY